MTDAERARLGALADPDLVGLTIYLEARGESESAQIGVGSVIRNRKTRGYRGDRYQTVCLAPRQFSCWNEGDPNRALGLDLAGRLIAARATDPLLRQCLFFGLGVVTDALLDNVHGARHYHDATASPSWAAAGQPTAIYGRLTFYVGVP